MYALYIHLPYYNTTIGYVSHRKRWCMAYVKKWERNFPITQWWLRDHTGWIDSADGTICNYDHNPEIKLIPVWFDPNPEQNR